MMKKYSMVMVMALSAAFASADLITPTKDATIKSASPTSNFGSENNITATRVTVMNKMYLTFDASGLAGAITNISSVNAFSLGTVYRGGALWLVTNSTYDVAWNESTITWNNAPGNDTAGVNLLAGSAASLGLFPSATAANQTIAFAFTDSSTKALLMDALNSGDRRATLVVLVNSGTQYITYASKESLVAGAHPLQMTVDVIPEPATIGMMSLALVVIGVFRRISTK